MSTRPSPSFLEVTPDAMCDKGAVAQTKAQAEWKCCWENTEVLKDFPLLLLKVFVQGLVLLQLQNSALVNSGSSVAWLSDYSHPAHQAVLATDDLGKVGIYGKKSSLWGWWGTGTGCPEQLWCPWIPGSVQTSVLDIGAWSTWDNGSCPCHSNVEQDEVYGSFQPKSFWNSMILLQVWGLILPGGSFAWLPVCLHCVSSAPVLVMSLCRGFSPSKCRVGIKSLQKHTSRAGKLPWNVLLWCHWDKSFCWIEILPLFA